MLPRGSTVHLRVVRVTISLIDYRVPWAKSTEVSQMVYPSFKHRVGENFTHRTLSLLIFSPNLKPGPSVDTEPVPHSITFNK
ncbi:hypothetical protein CDAR_63061 [Caerostris darwini]|uniref:Uncharacterized protein n=1 Tax=Caerostris darwini TaxID=1538125 RepID=A0AAV4UFF4_9ARAC|nr:hypothetical protein CDAR_63061 [Caerostris darwini]